MKKLDVVTNQLIPDNVNLDCLPSSVNSAVFEEINTLEELKKSTSNGIDINVDAFQGRFL
jgi:hypothetical protein